MRNSNNLFDLLTKELENSNHQILTKLFPFSSKRLLGINTTKELDRLFFKLLKPMNIDYLIECGAHEASASLNFINQGGKSIAIEANPFVYNNITPKSNENLIAINKALSNKKGKLDFFFPKNNNKPDNQLFCQKME